MAIRKDRFPHDMYLNPVPRASRKTIKVSKIHRPYGTANVNNPSRGSLPLSIL